MHLAGRVLRCLLATAGIVAAESCLEPAYADKATFDIYGFAQGDFIYDTQRVDPNWMDAFRPSKIATTTGEFGSNGQFSASAKQSRFGVKGTVPTGTSWGPITFKFEFDLFGTGVDAGQTTFRLRHAYGEWGPLLAGQTNSVFMDGDVFPNVIDYWGPPGMVFYRNVQIRLTPWRTDDSHFAIALERPGNDVDAGTVRELDPELGANLQGDEKLPDLTTHFYTKGEWGHVQIAAIVRDVAYDTLNTLHNEPKGSRVGWGFNLGANANLLERDSLIGQVVYGEGIASYMNDGGVDLAPEQVSPGVIKARAVPLLGVVAYYDHYWTDQLSTSLGYSFTQVSNTNFQLGDAFKKGEYASGNLLYTPTKDIMIGAEVMWGKRTNFDGTNGDDVRLQVSVKYSFGTSISI